MEDGLMRRKRPIWRIYKDFVVKANVNLLVIAPDLKFGVRLDIYLKDNKNTAYDVEIQTTNQHDLERRSRYDIISKKSTRELYIKERPIKIYPTVILFLSAHSTIS